ncbi:MAG TPA: flagellar FlbD family protein [Fibrobacteria bacterium]|nr:flagellar FlbD family protein [Fibrobacteria bacterium]
MIEVTKLNGETVFVNADHIETVESQPDTVIILAGGKHFLVREEVEEVVRRIVDYQRRVRSGLPGLDRSGSRPLRDGADGD